MRIRPLVAATTFAAVLPVLVGLTAPVEAEPAPALRAKAVKVTLQALPASSDVGRRLTIAGSATPAKKKGKKVAVKVTVQRSYGGAWQNVATGKTTTKGAYSFAVTLARGGTTAFRVVRAGGGVSPADSLAVYQWLDLADQPQVLFAQGTLLHRTSTVGGRAYAESYEFPEEFAFLTVKSAGLCTAMRASIGVLDREAASVPDGGITEASLYGFTPGSEPQETELTAPVGPAKAGTVDLTGKTYALVQIGNNSSDPDQWSAALLTPQLRCNATLLPSIEADEVPV